MNTSDGQRPTVLLVEDIDWIRARLKKRLEHHGYAVLEAHDAATAIEVAQRESPELILTEEQFPSLAALTTCLRRHSTLHDLPIIIVNPDADEHTRYGDAVVFNDFAQIESLLQREPKMLEKES